MGITTKNVLLLTVIGVQLLISGQSIAQASLTLGVFPYFDATTLARLHQPLKQHLATSTGQNIRLLSAPNFKTFKQRTAEGRYDILVTAPHLGRIAEKQAGYQWLGFTSNTSSAVFVTRTDSGIRDLKDLRGKSLALPPKPAIVHHLALREIENQGLDPEKDVLVKPQASHNNAMYMAIRGQTDAAAFGRPTWDRYDAADKASLVKIGESESIPGFALMVHPRVPDTLRSSLRQALYAFPATDSGRAYFDKTGLQGVRDATPADLERLDFYLAKIKAALKGKP